MKTRGLSILLGLLLLGTPGCLLDALLDTESREEQEVRHDLSRQRAGIPLKHHKTPNRLKRHQQDLQWRSWQDDDC